MGGARGRLRSLPKNQASPDRLVSVTRPSLRGWDDSETCHTTVRLHNNRDYMGDSVKASHAVALLRQRAVDLVAMCRGLHSMSMNAHDCVQALPALLSHLTTMQPLSGHLKPCELFELFETHNPSDMMDPLVATSIRPFKSAENHAGHAKSFKPICKPGKPFNNQSCGDGPAALAYGLLVKSEPRTEALKRVRYVKEAQGGARETLSGTAREEGLKRGLPAGWTVKKAARSIVCDEGGYEMR